MKPIRFLMCPPTYFDVQYVINPWMEGRVHTANPQGASQQWKRLVELISRDAQVQVMEPQNGLPDLVFTANAALIYKKTAVLSSFRCPERQPEEQYYCAWLKSAGFEIVTMPENVNFEGAGDALLSRDRPLLWAGHGYRSDLAASAFIQETLDLEVQPLRLDPRFYHLDTCFCPLQGGFLIYFAPAFDSASNAVIEARVPAGKRLAIDENDAVQFACNAVNTGGRVITNAAGPVLTAWLQERGFDAIQTDMTEFMKAGGAAKCLSLRLDESD